MGSESEEPLAFAQATATSYRPIPVGAEIDVLPASDTALASDSADTVVLILKQKGYGIVRYTAPLVADVEVVLIRGTSQDQGPAPAQPPQQGAVRGDQYSNVDRNPADKPLTRGNVIENQQGALLTPLRPQSSGHLLHVSISVYDRKTGLYVWRGRAERDSLAVGVESSLQQMIVGLLAHFGENLPLTQLPLY